MRKLAILAVAFVLMGLRSPVSAQVVFSENFDSYAAGTALHGKGGWKGWNNDAAAGAPTSSDYAYSGKNSVKITGATDLVHEFTVATGVCEFVTMQYIPVGATGNTYFILLNQYDDAGTTNDWSVQLNYNLATGIITAEAEGGSVTTEVIFGRWVELKFRIDLDKNTCEWYYAGELITTHVWDAEGSNTFQCVDLYANNADPVYYDDITVTHERDYKAGSPVPADGFVGVTMPLLQWSKGYLGYFHNVYFGTSPELTEANLVSSMTTSTLFYYFMGIEAGVTYYWRVDEVEVDGTTVHAGDVWSFTAMPLTAYSPSPADGSEGIAPFTTLSWQAPSEDATHRVYFGDDMDAVQAGDAAVDKGTTTDTSFDTGYLRSGSTYYWRVDEVAAGGSVEAGDVWSFTTFQPVDKQVVREWWMDITGTAVANLTDSALYPNAPTGRKLVDYMEGPVNWAEYYGTRLYGWLKPEKTGAYTFWISSDDMSELWLSTNDDPAKAVKIASVTGWTNSQDWDNGSGQGGTLQKSAAINLTAGQKYFIQALQKEGGGGDNIAVAWQPPNGAREVISAQFVDTYGLLPLTAAAPSPENGAVNTRQSLELSWFAGEKAVKHDVYFGDDAAAVAAADTASALYQGSQSGTTFDTGDLEWDKTYYWRIDEVAQGDADSPWKGVVWSFTTADFIPVDDFESYDDDENHLYDTWIDGLTNNTGSYVGYENASNGTFGETVRVHTGGQSMPIAFDNTKSPYYSEVSRTLAPVQNWTAGGVTTLSLFVRGKTAGDLGVVYVALEDSASKSAVVSYPDNTAAVSGAWIEWKIPLSSFAGVNPAKIKTIYIGVGNRTSPAAGGTGTIYVDDIRVVK